MEQIKEALNSLVDEALEASDATTDEDLKKYLKRAVHLENEGVDPNVDRSVAGKRNSDGSVSAKHWSFYNILKIDFGELMELYAKAAIIATVPVEAKIKLSAAVATLINFFYQKAERELHPSDVEVLYAMHRLEKRTIAMAEIGPSYAASFGKPLEESHLISSLDVLLSKKIISHLGERRYRIKEKVRFPRDR